MKQSLKYELLLLFTAFVWGAGFPITKIATENGFGPFTVNAGRFFVGTIVLAVIFYKQLHTVSKKVLIAGVLAGLLLFVSFAFQTSGIMFTTPSKNAFLTQTMVIYVPFISWFFYKETPKKSALIGALLALGGGLVLSFNINDFTSVNIGDLLTSIGAIAVAAHIVYSTHVMQKLKMDPIMFSILQFATAAIFSIVFAVMFDDVSRETSLVDWVPLIYLGVLNTAWGFTIQTFAHKHSSPSRTSIIVATEALFALVISVLLFDDVITVQLLLGGTLVIGSVLYVERNIRVEVETVG